MTWHETHERTRIIREVEAYSVCDPTGHLPWKESWAPFFGDRAGLLTALRSRWERMVQAQLEPRTDESVLVEQRLRRTHAGMLRILEAHRDQAADQPAEVTKAQAS